MVQLGKGLIDSIPLIIQNMGKIVEAIVSVMLRLQLAESRGETS